MRIFENCKELALNDGCCINRYNQALRIIYTDPYECGLEIDYNRINGQESMSVYVGGREVFHYHDGDQVDSRWYVVSGKWQLLVDELCAKTLPDADSLASYKAEAERNKSLLNESRERCLKLVASENVDKDMSKYEKDGIVVELQKSQSWRILHVFRDNKLMFFYRWCNLGHNLSCDKGRLVSRDWLDEIS